MRPHKSFFCARGLGYFGAILALCLIALNAYAQSDNAESENPLSALRSDILFLEESISDLTGRLEELQYHLTQLEDKIENSPTGDEAVSVSDDLQARLIRLEETLAGLENRLRQQESTENAAASAPVTTETVDNDTADLTHKAKAAYAAAYAHLPQRRYAEAEASFKDFLAEFPDTPLAGNASYWLGETYYVRKDYKTAAEQFLATYDNYPQSHKRFDALLKLALSLKSLRAEGEACKALAVLLATPENEFLNDTVRTRAEKENTALECQ